MTIDDIIKILKQGKGIRIEFKERIDSVPRSFYETVVSFSNTDGGTILLGVRAGSTVLGVKENNFSKMKDESATAFYLVPSWNKKGTQLDAKRYPAPP